jgi:hypothetical protein
VVCVRWLVCGLGAVLRGGGGSGECAPGARDSASVCAPDGARLAIKVYITYIPSCSMAGQVGCYVAGKAPREGGIHGVGAFFGGGGSRLIYRLRHVPYVAWYHLVLGTVFHCLCGRWH